MVAFAEEEEGKRQLIARKTSPKAKLVAMVQSARWQTRVSLTRVGTGDRKI
jgi:hypothetical protein